VKQNFGRILFLLSSLLGSAAQATDAPAADPSSVSRSLYAVNQSANARGSISVYDIDEGHRLIKTIQTVPSIGDPAPLAPARTPAETAASRRRKANSRERQVRT
jgi:hypothetical protein